MSVLITPPPEREGAPRVDLGLLRRRARLILRELGHARSELSVALVDDAAIARLNADYREKTRPTDVLSFSLLEGDHAGHRGRLLGDVVISVDTAARQARQRHRALAEELARLLIHGILHLLGHDHERDDEARLMRREERRLWRAVRAC
jgi:probable rRNA maturation factor